MFKSNSTKQENIVNIGGNGEMDLEFAVKQPQDFNFPLNEVRQVYTRMNTNGKILVVLLHGGFGDAKNFAGVCRVINQELDQPTILIPEFVADMFSCANPLLIVDDVIRLIDDYQQKRNFQEIILIGHSLGALLVRKVYICACGEIDKAPFEKELADWREVRDWAKKVKLIVLFAGMNRGWQIHRHLSPVNLLKERLLIVLGYIMVRLGREPLLFWIRRGGVFITNLRMQWLKMNKSRQTDDAKETANHPIVVQLLGSRDEFVSPDDHIDLVTGKDFVYIDVPQTEHFDIIKMGKKSDNQIQSEIENENKTQSEIEILSKRKEKFIKALNYRKGKRDDSSMNSLDDFSLPGPFPHIKNVVFVIHGIRDLGFWAKKIARKVREEGKRDHNKDHQVVYGMETSTYGYFAMLPFMLSCHRGRKVEWLMDQYVEDSAIYPNAIFHYVSHSNGTYLLAKALQEYPCCYFKRVVFTGSVVRTDYNWSEVLEKGQVEKVLNFVSTGDWVVAFFPKLLEMFNWQDLGSAGHDGFQNLHKTGGGTGDNPGQSGSNNSENNFIIESDQTGNITQVKYIKGGHGSGIQEKGWDIIAQFIVSGKLKTFNDEEKSLFEKRQICWIKKLSEYAFLVWSMIFLVLFLIGWIIVSLNIFEWQKIVLFIFYLWSIFWVVTRY